MMHRIGSAVRDGDGIAVRLVAGPRCGRYRVPAGETPGLLAGRAMATLRSDDAPVGLIAPSRDLRVLLGAFRDQCGFVGTGSLIWLGGAAFVIPRAHLAAHYARYDGPVAAYAGRGRRGAPWARPAVRDLAGEGDA